jgi:hypothetical protein
MIKDIIQNPVQQLTKASSVSTFEAERQSPNHLKLSPGQLVQAEVLASLPDNRFLARIAGELFKIELPQTTKPGETLRLTMVSDEPRLTFALSRAENSVAPVRISETGKWLSNLARDGISRQPPPPVTRSEMLLTGPPVDTGTLATLLREALSMSGVFYESHLVQWFLGERQLKDILKEPQAKLAPPSKTPPDAQPPGDKVPLDGHNNTLGKALDLISAEPANSASRQEPAEPVDPRAIPIIQDQLHTLQSGSLAWLGQAWPGQLMDWTVSEQESESGEKAGKNWHTTLKLHLPNLGEVHASLQLNNEGVHMLIKAERNSTVTVLLEEQQELEQAMSAAGVNLLGMVVEQEDHGPGK